jgi:diadenosine tetraphosphate (Ap4A) HIT family hydrolase
MPGCELCQTDGGKLLWESRSCRVVRVADAHYPGFCRVVWNAHVKEMSDLDSSARSHLMDVVFGVEGAVRKVCSPDKVNLASLGNLTPHLHWHVIPRWRDDRNFPDPIWAAARRPDAAPRPEVDEEALLAALETFLAGVKEAS